MSQLWWLWIRNRWRGVSAALAMALALLIVIRMTMGGWAEGVTFLGNAQAPRAAANLDTGIVLPRSSDPNAQPGNVSSMSMSILDRGALPGSGPQSIAAAQMAWDAQEIRQHQQEVLAALNCAREQQGQSALTLDPALSQTAGGAWLKLIHDHSWSLMQLPGQYSLRSVMALDFAAPNLASEVDQQRGVTDTTDGACAIGGFDAATLQMAKGATTIGIAVFPPQTSWDLASAVVLVK
jgi:hypothetical protein